ncbi:hypothetical protein ACWFMI_27300 [Nocardiopsis terrae]
MKPLLDALAEIDLADTTRPGGIRARIEEVAGLIRDEVEAAHTGRPAPVTPLTTDTETRRAA